MVLAVRITDGTALISGLLICVFIYWGWESSVNVTEETENGATSSGKAAIISTVILLVTYVSVATAMVAFAGLGAVEGFADDAILSTIATDVLGSPLDKIVSPRCPTAASKHSGHGKDLSMYGLEDYTRIKHIMTNLKA